VLYPSRHEHTAGHAIYLRESGRLQGAYRPRRVEAARRSAPRRRGALQRQHARWQAARGPLRRWHARSRARRGRGSPPPRAAPQPPGGPPAPRWARPRRAHRRRAAPRPAQALTAGLSRRSARPRRAQRLPPAAAKGRPALCTRPPLQQEGAGRKLARRPPPATLALGGPWSTQRRCGPRPQRRSCVVLARCLAGPPLRWRLHHAPARACCARRAARLLLHQVAVPGLGPPPRALRWRRGVRRQDWRRAALAHRLARPAAARRWRAQGRQQGVQRAARAAAQRACAADAAHRARSPTLPVRAARLRPGLLAAARGLRPGSGGRPRPRATRPARLRAGRRWAPAAAAALWASDQVQGALQGHDQDLRRGWRARPRSTSLRRPPGLPLRRAARGRPPRPLRGQ